VCAGPVEPGVRTRRGRSVLIVHGTCDRMTYPADSYAFASRIESRTACLARFEVTQEVMLRGLTFEPAWSVLSP
jgi:hypothetical protein